MHKRQRIPKFIKEIYEKLIILIQYCMDKLKKMSENDQKVLNNGTAEEGWEAIKIFKGRIQQNIDNMQMKETRR